MDLSLTVYLSPSPGPAEWHRNFPIAQGNRQSPINIVANQAVFNPSLKPLVVSYDQSTSISLSNNGHSVMVEFDDNDDKTGESTGPLIKGPPHIMKSEGPITFMDADEKFSQDHRISGLNTSLHQGLQKKIT